MNKYNVKIEEINSILEEEVTLTLKGNKIICFATFCPYLIEENNVYPASFSLFIVDDYNIVVEKIPKENFSFEKIGEGFSYWINGLLKDGILYSLIPFKEPILLEEFWHYDNSFIRLRVDRIDVSFLD